MIIISFNSPELEIDKLGAIVLVFVFANLQLLQAAV
jgi:hypothetical protein